MEHTGDELTIPRPHWVLLALLGGMFTFAGVVFSAAGGLIALSPNAPPNLGPGLLLLGIALLLPGLTLLLLRQGTTIDRRARTVNHWMSLLGQRWETVDTLDGITQLELSVRERNRSEAKSYFLAQLTGGSGYPIRLFQWRRETPAREMADAVAKFLDLPLHDKTAATLWRDEQAASVVRRPEEIGQSVGERVRGGLEAIAPVKPPEGMLSHIESLPDGIRVTFPPQGLSEPLVMVAAMMIVPLLFAVLVFPILIVRFAGEPLAGSPLLICPMLPGFVLAFAVVFFLVGAARAQLKMEIRPTEVFVHGSLWKMAFPASRLEEVRVEGKGGNWRTPCFVLLRGAGQTARVGGNRTSRQECEFLAALVRATVSKDFGEQPRQEASPAK